MNTPDWPHEKIFSAALRYITQHTKKEPLWRFTRLDGLPERLSRIVRLEASERPIVTCFVDAQRWYAMTTALHMQRMAATINFSKTFSSDKQSNRATQKFLDAHPEQPLLAYVLAECASWLRQISDRRTEAETDKYPLMASLNLSTASLMWEE